MRKRKVPRLIHYFNALRFYMPDMGSEELFDNSKVLCGISYKEAKRIAYQFAENITEEQKKLAMEIPPKVLTKTYNYLKDKEYL